MVAALDRSGKDYSANDRQSVELAPYVPMKVGKGGPSGGGGGDASKLKASTGVPPKAAKQQFTPPTVLPQQKSKLMIEPTVVADHKDSAEHADWAIRSPS